MFKLSVNSLTHHQGKNVHVEKGDRWDCAVFHGSNFIMVYNGDTKCWYFGPLFFTIKAELAWGQLALKS